MLPFMPLGKKPPPVYCVGTDAGAFAATLYRTERACVKVRAKAKPAGLLALPVAVPAVLKKPS